MKKKNESWSGRDRDMDFCAANTGGPAKHLRLIFCDNAGLRRCRQAFAAALSIEGYRNRDLSFKDSVYTK